MNATTIEKANKADLAAMEAFALNIPKMTEREIIAAANWIRSRADWEVKHRQRWPWWELDL